jgi:predicted transcriptional regulator
VALVNRAAKEDGWTARKAFEDKMGKYSAAWMELAPLATDMLGGWSPK